MLMAITVYTCTVILVIALSSNSCIVLDHVYYVYIISQCLKVHVLLEVHDELGDTL